MFRKDPVSEGWRSEHQSTERRSPARRRSAVATGREHAAAETIRNRCVENGWDLRELAQRAGVSRTTLHHLLSGATRRPHLATLGRLAAALGVEAAEFGSQAEGHHGVAHESAPLAPPLRPDRAGTFDRSTNPAVHEVSRTQPGLFAGWTRDEWDELYSTFGVGGHLSSEGVIECAQAINDRRETTRQLHLVLETHLAEVARQFVQTLYDMVRAEGGSLSGGQQPEA